jgi:GAF domain-containing protein
LLNELRESLQQQTATADVLKVISRSTFDLQAVLDTLVESAARLCGAEMANIWRPRDGGYRHTASYGVTARYKEYLENKEFLNTVVIEPSRSTTVGRVLLERRTVHIHDIQADPDYKLSGLVALGGTRTMLGVPILRQGEPIGVLVLVQSEVRPFTDKQIGLATTFADQAAIAIENTRLLNELRGSLDRQTAMSEVLSVISSSPGELTPVFESMLANAMRICEAQCGFIYRIEAGVMRTMAEVGVPRAFAEYRRNHPHTGGAKTLVDEMRATKKPAHVHDARESEAYRMGNPNAVAGVDLGGARTALYVPMLRDGEIVGVINVYRQEVRPFADDQIALLENFAAQAVIAIENARLLSELRETLDRQTATSEVLGVISASPGELEPVFAKILENAARICEAKFASTLFVLPPTRVRRLPM